MSVTTTTHLNFRGTARAALDFYQSVFGGRTVTVTYKDAGAVRDESEADWVMWGEVAGDNGFHVMAYDVPSQLPWNQGENAFFVSVRGDGTEEINALWDRLAEGSTIVSPWRPPSGPRCTACSPTASASPGCWTSPLRTTAEPARLRRPPGAPAPSRDQMSRRSRVSQSVRVRRAVAEMSARGYKASKPWNPPAQTWSSAWPPAAQMRVA